MKLYKSMHIFYLFAQFLFIASCLPVQSVESKTLKPSDLNASPSFYDGKDVTVTGYLVIDGTDRYFSDSEKVYENSPSDNICVSLLGAGYLIHDRFKYNKQIVTLRGVFIKNYNSKNIVMLGPCNISALDISAHPLPIENKGP